MRGDACGGLRNPGTHCPVDVAALRDANCSAEWRMEVQFNAMKVGSGTCPIGMVRCRLVKFRTISFAKMPA
jgi:hypothetical protein